MEVWNMVFNVTIFVLQHNLKIFQGFCNDRKKNSSINVKEMEKSSQILIWSLSSPSPPPHRQKKQKKGWSRRGNSSKDDEIGNKMRSKRFSR